jgi:hypothetical protein
MNSLFLDSYEASRARFLRDVEPLRARWHSSRLETHPLNNFPDLSIDWCWLEPKRRENLVIVSTAQHGIEGYVGSAMLKVFTAEFAPRINPENTGLLLIHAINPWGMKHGRKVNENGVDLNRNFILNGVFDKSVNPQFSNLRNFLAPSYRAHSFGIENLFFVTRIIKALITEGASSISTAALLGQYVDSKAMYYGGDRQEEETQVVIRLFREALENYQNVIHLDQHSGYGPRYQMSLTLVPPEPRTSAELSAKFHYPLVLKGDNQEFYETHGDMCACLYELRNAEFPEKPVFATAFEFGTYGESLMQRIHSLRTMILESQLYWHGAANKATVQKIRHDFQQLYFPAQAKWREKALADGRRAFAGILGAYNALQISADHNTPS